MMSEQDSQDSVGPLIDDLKKYLVFLSDLGDAGELKDEGTYFWTPFMSKLRDG